MTDSEIDRTTTAAPPWFKIAAWAAVAWEAFGCFMYIQQMTLDRTQLPLDQRMMWNWTPWWIVAAYAIAVWIGLIGAGGLVLRRLWAIPTLGLSLLAVIVQFGGVFFVPRLRQSTSPGDMLVPLVITIVCAAIYALAHLAHHRGWLR